VHEGGTRGRCPGDGFTPLILASISGHVGVMRELCAGVYRQLSVAGAVW